MPRTKKIETHGKVEEKPIVFTSLEQIWGSSDPSSKFGTTDAKVYAEKVNEMNRADLEREARRLSLVICESTARLKERVLQEFDKYFFYLDKPDVKHPAIQATKEALKVMAEGR